MKQIKLGNYFLNYQVFFKKNKHMYLRVKNNQIIVTCNKTMNETMIETFIQKHKRWIINRINLDVKETVFENQLPLWGVFYPINYLQDAKEKVAFYNETWVIKGTCLKKEWIEEFYKKEILKKINQILIEEKPLLDIYLSTERITFKTQLMKTRLGSCISSKRIIKINSLLSRFDEKYLKLVLFHELSHLVHQNHSSKFHDFLEMLYPNHKQETRKLNQLVQKSSFTSDIGEKN